MNIFLKKDNKLGLFDLNEEIPKTIYSLKYSPNSYNSIIKNKIQEGAYLSSNFTFSTFPSAKIEILARKYFRLKFFEKFNKTLYENTNFEQVLYFGYLLPLTNRKSMINERFFINSIRGFGDVLDPIEIKNSKLNLGHNFILKGKSLLVIFYL